MTELRLAGDGLSAAVDSHGAQLQSFHDRGGHELLWQGDPASWPDRALVLFPVIGPLVDGELHHGGGVHQMPPHGFAHLREFAVAEQSDGRCVLELRDDAETREAYPFPFVFTASFELRDGGLENVLTVSNPGEEALPCDVGFHPGFRWPLEPERSKQEYSVVFDREEPAPIRRGSGDPVLLYPEPRQSPVEEATLRLRDELFEDLAIVWDRLDSRSVTYGALGGRGLRVEFPDSPHLGIWMIPGAAFVCIEPWQGYPSPSDFRGEIADKPGIGSVEPRGSRSWRMRVTPVAEVEA